VISIGQGDTEHSTILHVPALHAVVGGDVVYNQVHMMTAETGEKEREDWIASLDRIAALQPRIVVSGHKRVGAADDPRTIGESQQYLRDFSRIVASEDAAEDIVAAMLKRHPGRDNPRVVWHSAREAVKKRQ
jgi:glyoxylase-like metal-dependent hydrolase (beta-lactamase superfamily II)